MTETTEVQGWERGRLFRILFAAVVGTASGIALLLRFSNSSVQSVHNFAQITLDSVAGSGPVASTVLVVALAYVAYRTIPVLFGAATTTREKVVSYVCGGLLSLTIIVPGQWYEHQEHATGFPWYVSGDMNWHMPVVLVSLAAQWLSVSLLLALLFARLWTYLSDDNVRLAPKDAAQRLPRLSRLISKLDFKPLHLLVGALLLLLCWVPILIINGPISVPVDSMMQLIQMRGFPAWDPMMMTPLPGYSLTDHHPFLDSYSYAAFDSLGLAMGNEMLGLMILTWCQAFVGAFSLVVILAWVNVRVRPRVEVMAVAFAVFAFVPAWSSYMTIIMKDSTWIPFFTIWCVMFFEYIHRIAKGKKVGVGFIVGFILIAILAGLMRKTSIYVTTPSLLLVVIFARQRIKSVITALVPPVVALMLIPSMLFPVLKIAPGGTQEAIGTPMQQITKVLINHQSEIAPADMAAIKAVMKAEKAKKDFKPSTVDPVKHSFRTGVDKKAVVSFLFVWVKLFFKYPGDYFAAVPFIRNAFLIGPTYYTNGSMKCGWEPSGGYAVLPDVPECGYSQTQERLSQPLIETLRRIPPFSLIGAEGIYVSWIPVLAVALCVLKKRYRNLLLLAPVLLTWCNLLIIPAPQQRYSLGMLFPTLLFALTPFLSLLKDQAQAEKGNDDADVA